MAEPMVQSAAASPPGMGTAVRAERPQALIALTQDAPLVRALQELSTSGCNVSVVPDLRNLTDLLLQNAGDTVLIDTAALESPVTEVVDMIARQLPDLCIMVAGHSTDQQQLVSRLANKTVFRFVHKPASPQRLRLTREGGARLAAPAPAVATASVDRVLTRPATAGGNRIPRNAILGAVAALVAIVLAIFLFWPDSAAPPVAPATVAA